MTKNRLEAFSDGVIAIIITIMVLELHAPQSDSLSELRAIAPQFGSYVLSFAFLGIYWSNHHHMLQAISKVNGKVLWANLHLLFWLSLVPFGTAWMGTTGYAKTPVAVYGCILLAAAIAYTILVRALVSLHGRNSSFARALGSDFKGLLSRILYAVSIPLAFVHPAIACAIFVIVAVMWLIPDRRFERALTKD